ncbi:hypothetical protein FXO38_06398 [Capsicum annuum]|nr:hypothetical protein FXO38_06398 [Capsicum annuum]KAF3674348.1 hypothetical protein FXO37_06449 [Capsicum annuum]
MLTDSLNLFDIVFATLSRTRKPETTLFAELDGTVSLREQNSLNTMKPPLWSFSSGPSICSSYQAPINYNNSSEVSSDIGSGYFIDYLLKHDKMLSKKAPAPHLRDVPNYLLDPTTQDANKIVKLARAAMGNTNPSRGKGSKRRLFRKLDDDHNGYLTPPELEKLTRNVNFREENAEKIYVCIDDETINYLNRQDMRRALHARLIGVRSWDVCNTDSSRPVLRVYVVEKTRANENQNIEEQQQEDIFYDRLDDLDMNISDDDQTPMPVDATNSWHHTYGSEHISGQNPHTTTKVLGEYFMSSFLEGKGPSTRVISNQILTKLGVLVSYWKIYLAMGINKDLVRRTHEHGYLVLEAYRYMIESTNPKSKKTLHVDESRRFK